MTSLKEVNREHTSLEMPDIETEHGAGYLVGLLYEAGLMSSSGMGPVPLSWAEIDAWIRCTDLQLTTWERLTIKRMSEEYVAERCETDPNRISPYKQHVEERELAEMRNDVNDKLMNMLSFFRKPDPKQEDNAEDSAEGN